MTPTEQEERMDLARERDPMTLTMTDIADLSEVETIFAIANLQSIVVNLRAELARAKERSSDSVTVAEIRLAWAKFQANECSVIANMDFVKAVRAALSDRPATGEGE